MTKRKDLQELQERAVRVAKLPPPPPLDWSRLTARERELIEELSEAFHDDPKEMTIRELDALCGLIEKLEGGAR